MVYLQTCHSNSSLQHAVSSQDREILKKLQKADYALYQFFAKEFEKKVAAYGEKRMAADVEKLKNLR